MFGGRRLVCGAHIAFRSCTGNPGALPLTGYTLEIRVVRPETMLIAGHKGHIISRAMRRCVTPNDTVRSL